jgi:hypothetical protein
MTRLEHMQQLTKADILIIDEIDETILDEPYAFQSNSESLINGIWNWKDYQVIGFSATSYGNI